MCMARVGTCTAKKETTLSHTNTHLLTVLWMPTILDHSVFVTPLNPNKPLPLTDAQRLTRGYCGLIQRKSTVKHNNTKRWHTQCWWKIGLTDWLLPCWQTAGSISESKSVKGLAFVFGTCLSGPEEHSEKEGEDKDTLFCPHCVQSAERDVEYQNDPEVEEVLSHQHSILVLHDPLQVDWTSLICFILVQVHHFQWSFLDFYGH